MRRNAYASIGAQWLNAVSTIIASVLVARMMLPAELGVFTVTMAIVGVLGAIQSGGVGEYLIYADEGDMDTRRRVLGLALLTTVATIIFLLAMRPVFVAIYGEPGIADVLSVIPVALAVSVFAMPVSGMLAREEQFVIVSKAGIATGLTLSISQVLFVALGFSYMGLAYAAVLSSMVSLGMSLLLAPQFALFRPVFGVNRKMATFGARMMGSNIVTSLNMQSPAIAIGALGNVAQAALYGRANMVSQVYSQTIPRAIDPLIRARIGALRRSGGDGIATVLQTSHFMLAIAVAFFGFTAIAADLIVPLIYGPQWTAAIPAMQVLSIGFLFFPLNSPAVAYLIAEDRLDVVLRIRVVNLVVRVGLLIALVPFGLTWAAFAVLLSAYVNLVQNQLALRRHGGMSLRDFVTATAPSFAAGAFPVGVTLGARVAMAQAGIDGWTALLLSGACMGLATVASLRLFRHPLWNEGRMLFVRFARRNQ